jgi:hypothetical protein
MEKKINLFNYLHSDIQFDELLVHLPSSLFFSPSPLKVVRVCVFVCEYFSFVFAPLIKVFFLSNKQAFETYIYASRKMMTTELMPEHTPNSLRVQTVIYKPSKIIQKALSPLIFFTLHFTEFGK